MKQSWLVVALIMLAGCTAAISQAQAEQLATEFINQNVKFFAKEGDDRTNLNESFITSVSSYQENGQWVVIAHIEAPFENGTKDNDMIVTLDRKGKVLLFNGVPVPQ